MAYSKQTWDTTSYVNPTRMNHIEQGIYDASSVADGKLSPIIEDLASNVYLSDSNTWTDVPLSKNINNYKWIGFSFTTSDNSPTQSLITCFTPVSAFKTSTRSLPIAIVQDVFSPSDTKSLYLYYDSDTGVKAFRGSNIYQYFRLSIFGIGKIS